MRGSYGVGNKETERFVKPGDELTYTIYFENMTNATAAAQEVYVTNALSQYLDWSTFKMGEVVFGEQIDLGLVGKQGGTSEATMKGTNLVVRTKLTVEAARSASEPYQAVWYMRIVDPTTKTGWPEDIVAGFLPPNDETGRGEGHLTYTICVRKDAPANLVISNSADIVFDHNPVIKTNPAWWNTVAPDIGEVHFAEADVVTDEGSNVVVRVLGGDVYTNSSVKVYATWNTAGTADVDLAKGTITDAQERVPPVANLKFPLTLKWAAGEVGEKIITIPVKADALVEGEEFFTLQLAAASRMELGEERVCTVRIRDAQWPEGMSEADAQERVPPGATAVKTISVVDGVTNTVTTGYFTKKDKKGNVTAKAMPGYVFVGWVYANGKTYSTKATITDKLRKSKKVKPKFAVAHYLRGLADPANGGKVTGSGKYAEGKSVTLKATPTKYWSFEGWYRGSGTLAASDGAGGSDMSVASPNVLVSKKASIKVAVTNDATYFAAFKPYPKVTVAVDNKAGGTVKGAGSYLAGKVATLTATPKKGYAFSGWWNGTNLISLAASYKYKVTADGASLTASFKKEGELEKPTFTWGGETNLTVGVSYSAKLSVKGESAVSITKVTGLPKGLSYKSGKVSGVPTVKKACTVTVTVALNSNKKKTWTYKVKPAVAALPAWAVGTFRGKLYEPATGETPVVPVDGDPTGETPVVPVAKGTVTLTVGTTGKVSGKFVDTKKKSYSFAVGSFKSFADDVLRTKAGMKYGKKTVTVDVAVGQDGETSVGFAEVGSAAAPFSGGTAVLVK